MRILFILPCSLNDGILYSFVGCLMLEQKQGKGAYFNQGIFLRLAAVSYISSIQKGISFLYSQPTQPDILSLFNKGRKRKRGNKGGINRE